MSRIGHFGTRGAALAALTLLAGCGTDTPAPAPAAVEAPKPVLAADAGGYYGTREPFSAEAVYFLITDRFVNGDPGNDHREQGGARGSFDIPTPGGPPDRHDNIGYLGGDFKGILDHADYIREMGFGAIWLTPIVDNPDEAFAGGEPATWDAMLRDGGKSGYHGYWGVNFYQLDEHWPSPGLGFRELTAGLKDKGLKTVLDVVANHGSPSFGMVEDQPKFGEIYDREGRLVADHQNLPPEQLDPAKQPLHAFFHQERDLVQLSNLDEDNPAVLDYLAGAYLMWIEQGVDAVRIDTLGHMPLSFWKRFTDRLRAGRPGLFIMGERFSYEAAELAKHTWPENGAISVLDFPLKQALSAVMSQPGSDYREVEAALHLENGPYTNPYELLTFYDNHDMPRLAASDQGFINAHNFLFTARGIPVIYYGSEMGFMRGTGEHAGNRNYFGVEGIAAARQHPIRAQLIRIAELRRQSPVLQRGLQLNLLFEGDRAAFLRVLEDGEQSAQALVLLNKGDEPAHFQFDHFVDAGRWVDALSALPVEVGEDGYFAARLAPHDVAVYQLTQAPKDPELRARLDQAMQQRLGPVEPKS